MTCFCRTANLGKAGCPPPPDHRQHCRRLIHQLLPDPHRKSAGHADNPARRFPLPRRPDHPLPTGPVKAAPAGRRRAIAARPVDMPARSQSPACMRNGGQSSTPKNRCTRRLARRSDTGKGCTTSKAGPDAGAEVTALACTTPAETGLALSRSPTSHLAAEATGRAWLRRFHPPPTVTGLAARPVGRILRRAPIKPSLCRSRWQLKPPVQKFWYLKPYPGDAQGPGQRPGRHSDDLRHLLQGTCSVIPRRSAAAVSDGGLRRHSASTHAQRSGRCRPRQRRPATGVALPRAVAPTRSLLHRLTPAPSGSGVLAMESFPPGVSTRRWTTLSKASALRSRISPSCTSGPVSI
jgi:hypothetical protein